MKQFFKAVCAVMLLTTEASASGILVSQKAGGKTKVVSQAFCESSLPEKDKIHWKRFTRMQNSSVTLVHHYQIRSQFVPPS